MSAKLKNSESAALNPWTTHGLYINLPIGVLAFVLGRKLSRESQDASARTLPDSFGVGLGLRLSDIVDQYRYNMQRRDLVSERSGE